MKRIRRILSSGCLAAALLVSATAPADVCASDDVQSLLDSLGGDQNMTEESYSEESQTTLSGAVSGVDGAGSDSRVSDEYTILSGFVMTEMNNTIAVQVPDDWGKGGGTQFFTYSPVNQSGAISPGAGTLLISWYSNPVSDINAALQDYEEEIRKQNNTSNITSESTIAAGQPATDIHYQMSVGANTFDCEVVCFNYNDNMYAVEMEQGGKSVTDYFPVFEDVVSTMAVMDENWSTVSGTQGEEGQTGPNTEEQPVDDNQTGGIKDEKPTDNDQTETISGEQEEPDAQVSAGPTSNDLGDFVYAINGNQYTFPTNVSDLNPGDLPINTNLGLPYQFDVSAAENGGIANELVNTEHFTFESAVNRELIGVTNLTGNLAPMTSGVVTALIDTQGTYVNLSLPGGIRIGSSEAEIAQAFPEFSGRALDGLAGFRGNEILYACNKRDDGCNGYVIIRNDAPFYSTLSIICENGAVREINFECLGNARANGIFL